MQATERRVSAPTSTCLYDPGMAKERMISAQEARDGFSEVVTAAERDDLHSVVVRRSKAAAVVVPPEWYRAARAAMNDPTNV